MADTMNNNLEGQLTILKSALEELAISFGELLLPAVKNIVSFLQGFVDILNSMPEGMKQTIVTIALVAAAIGPVLIVVGKVISAIGTIMTIVPQIVGVINTVKTAFAALNVTMLANPITLIIAAIAALVAAFISTVVNGIKSTITTVWNGIKTVISTVTNGIKSTLTSIWNGIKNVISNVVNGIRNTISTVWESIKSTVSNLTNSIKDAVSNVFNAMWNAIKSTVSGIYNSIREGFNNAVSFITGLASSAWQWGADIINGIVDDIRSCIGAVTDAVKDVAGTIKSFLHFSVPDEGPLTDFESWMPDFMEGLAQGIEKSKGLVKDAVDSVAQDMVLSPRMMLGQASVGEVNAAYGSAVSGASGSDRGSLISAIREAVSGISMGNAGEAGDIVIPVYLGNQLLDEVIVTAQQRMNL